MLVGVRVGSALPAATSAPWWRRASSVALLLLCVQNAALLLLSRYSLSLAQETYSLPALVLLIEGWKMMVCAAVLWAGGSPVLSAARRLARTIGPAALPGALVALTTLFQFEAIRHMAAAQFAVLQCGRLMAVALFGVLFASPSPGADGGAAAIAGAGPSPGGVLAGGGASGGGGGSVSPRRARLILILCLGCVVVYSDPATEASQRRWLGVGPSAHTGAWSDKEDLPFPPSAGPDPSLLAGFAERAGKIGLLALLGMVVLDGAARVYMDRKLLRPSVSATAIASEPPGPPLTLWERNAQLSFCGVCMSCLVLVATEWPMIVHTFAGPPASAAEQQLEGLQSVPLDPRAHPRHFFHGFSFLAAAILALQSFGSLLLAYLLRHVSARAQSGAAVASMGLVLAYSAASPLFDLRCGAAFLAAAATIATATWSWHAEKECGLCEQTHAHHAAGLEEGMAEEAGGLSPGASSGSVTPAYSPSGVSTAPSPTGSDALAVSALARDALDFGAGGGRRDNHGHTARATPAADDSELSLTDGGEEGGAYRTPYGAGGGGGGGGGGSFGRAQALSHVAAALQLVNPFRAKAAQR